MTNFKLYGKTKAIKKEIDSFAKSIGGFTKIVNNTILAIVLTDAKTTKGRTKKIIEFALKNNLKCFTEKYDGSFYSDKNINYSDFAKNLK